MKRPNFPHPSDEQRLAMLRAIVPDAEMVTEDSIAELLRRGTVTTDAALTAADNGLFYYSPRLDRFFGVDLVWFPEK